ncbi:hypothetical protein THIOM_003531 [Candidatus Thiomargarita nelsonii]|uniref:Uncharacterized protein n=1 Tax=Candidatus Thiomargarita nelsonii TaxID=1003181 RepID=A0A176RY75_9GAMM|nr:hypothetical protein THIOM_003531 [Candidatus Thiomargarita nelsonii]
MDKSFSNPLNGGATHLESLTNLLVRPCGLTTARHLIKCEHESIFLRLTFEADTHQLAPLKAIVSTSTSTVSSARGFIGL